MPKKNSQTRPGISVTFYYHKEAGYSWSLNDKNAKGVIGNEGFNTILNVAFDYDFLKALRKYLGKSSVPDEIFEIAKRKADEEARAAIPFSEEMLRKLETGLGMKIKRSKSKVSRK